MTLDNSTKPSEDAVAQKVGDEMVVLNLESGIYYGLDAVGSRVWELLLEHGRLQVVFETMAAEYEVTPEVLQQDLLHLVQELQARGLIQVVGA